LNRQIIQLFGLAVLLFAVLVAFTSRWAVFESEELEAKPTNRRALIAEQRVPRGLVQSRDGTVLARSRAVGSGESRRFVRTYPAGPLFSHAVGYSFVERGRAGLEKSRNDELSGEENEFESIIDELAGGEREGNDVTTTLDASAQRIAVQALGGQRGSIVAVEPDTGRVRVMASVPEFDPNVIPDQFEELNRGEGSPLFNRATQARYPPGSIFKVVTAAAALDSGDFNPDSVVDGGSPKTIGGVPLQNFGGQSFGPITLTEALTNSVNTVWAQVGERTGKDTLLEYMGRFGFGQELPLDYPREQIAPSGIYDGRGRLLDADAGFDIGRVAIGQGGAEGAIQVSPLQMAMVAAAVGNQGRLMGPRLTERIVAPDGRVKERVNPSQAARVMSERTADQLGEMMSNVVKEGSGTAAALSGISVAGKTGTAEVDGATANQAWFIAFAPLEDPQMAIAVTVERTQGQGGTVAAPLAKRVLQDLLGERAG
jgi:peptidoglycan glycosyltransferase